MSAIRSLLFPFAKPKKRRSVEEDIQIDDSPSLDEIDNVLDTHTLDEIYPFSWEEKTEHIEAGSNYIRVLAITGYPNQRSGNWLNDLKRKKGNITISQHLESADDSRMVHHYNETIKNKQVEMEKSVDPYLKKQLTKQIESANLQLDKYLNAETTYIKQHTYIFLQANSLKELDNLNDSVVRTLTRLRLQQLTPTKAMYHAFWSSLPIEQNLLTDYTSRLSNTEAASSFMPFDDAEILNLTPTAQVEGVNRETGSLIAVDYFNRNKTLNQNMVIIGTAGVGKSTYMMQKIMRLFAMGYRVFIIDPENEYTNIVNELGGQVIHLSSNAETKINPFQIFSSDTGNEEINETVDMIVKNKIERLKAFFNVLKPDLSKVEKALLDKVIRDTYDAKGIFQYDAIEEIPKKGFPTLSDLYEQLQILREKDIDRFERLQDFFYILESYCLGSNTIFDGPTNVNLNDQLVSFNLKRLQNEHDVQAAAYLNTFSFLWDEITQNRDEAVYCFIDEFHFLSKNPDSMNFFYSAYKRFRKYNAGAIAGTQQIQDVLDAANDLGAAVIENSFTKVFFGLDNVGVEEVASRLKENFSKEERRLLSAKRQGEALFIHGSNRAFMKVQLTQEELRLWDKARYEKEYDLLAFDEPDYTENVRISNAEIEESKAHVMS